MCKHILQVVAKVLWEVLWLDQVRVINSIMEEELKLLLEANLILGVPNMLEDNNTLEDNN